MTAKPFGCVMRRRSRTWQQVSDGRRWAADDLDADQVAALLLWDWMGLPRRLGPSVLL